MVHSRLSVLRRTGFLSFSILLGLILLQSAAAATIGGFVYDDRKNPVQRVDVELLNENYALRGRTKTDAVGRYVFDGVSDGRYYIRVLPFRFNLRDQTQEVKVDTLSLLGSGNGVFELDFYLQRKKGMLGDTTTGVVFVQDVPKEAEKFYEEAQDDLENGRTEEGFKKLVEAIKIFPNYYAAAQTLGIELLKNQQYMEAMNLFVRAAEANPKSSKAFYYMAVALKSMGQKYNRSALLALDKAIALAPASWEVVLLAGKLERQEGNFLEAEKHLLRAKKLADVRIPEIHKELAQLYANDLKQYGKAADELEDYLKASGQDDSDIKDKIEDLRRKAKNT